jgi:hypothetical protein
LRNEPPPEPGACPISEVPEPGSAGTLVSSVAACAIARPVVIPQQINNNRLEK